MTTSPISQTVRVCRQVTKYMDIDVSVTPPEDATPEAIQALIEERAIEAAYDEDFTTAADAGEPEYFVE